MSDGKYSTLPTNAAAGVLTSTMRAAPIASTLVAGSTVIMTPTLGANLGSIQWSCTGTIAGTKYAPKAC